MTSSQAELGKVAEGSFPAVTGAEQVVHADVLLKLARAATVEAADPTASERLITYMVQYAEGGTPSEIKPES